MKYLVTGGSGFIGKKISRIVDGCVYDLPDNDILDTNNLFRYISNCDHIIHLAAIADLNWALKNPEKTLDVNVLGTKNIGLICSKLDKKLTYISTCCVYGNQKTHPSNEETLPNPAEIYAASKLAGENILEGISRSYGLRYNIARIATTYGPGMRPALGVHIFFRQAVSGEDITVHGDGKQTRTLTYIDDTVRGILSVVEYEKSGEIFNISSDEEISAIDMARKIKNISNSNSEIIHIDQRPGQTFKESIDTIKAKNVLGFSTRVSFKSGLEKTNEKCFS